MDEINEPGSAVALQKQLDDLKKQLQSRSVFSRIRHLVGRFFAWLITAVAPTGDKDDLETEGVLVRKAGSLMNSKRKTALVVALSMFMLVVWSILLFIWML